MNCFPAQLRPPKQGSQSNWPTKTPAPFAPEFLSEVANRIRSPLLVEPMPTVGEQLREGREARKLDVYQVAEITKIKTDHIRALEQGNYDGFSATVYIRGFVRTYASLLKLNVPQVLATLDTELSSTERFSEPPALSQHVRGPLDFLMLYLSRLNWKVGLIASGILLALVLIAFGVRFWRSRQAADPLRNLGSGMYQPKEETIVDLLPLPTNAPPRR